VLEQVVHRRRLLDAHAELLRLPRDVVVEGGRRVQVDGRAGGPRASRATPST
jgi:hypothetical protein